MIVAPSLHILLFGDSLTAGLVRTKMEVHPYGLALQNSLQTAYPKINITIDNQGRSGDSAISPPGRFYTRMDMLYSPPSKPYTHAIILGGVNDFSVGHTAPEIFEALQKVWAIPLANSTTLLALTLTDCPACLAVPQSWIDELNADILGYDGGDNFHTFDLNSKIPWTDIPDEQRKEIWDDGIHFTEKGYDMIGELIAERLIEIIGPELKDVVLASRTGVNTGLVFLLLLGFIIYFTSKTRRKRRLMHEMELGDVRHGEEGLLQPRD